MKHYFVDFIFFWRGGGGGGGALIFRLLGGEG